MTNRAAFMRLEPTTMASFPAQDNTSNHLTTLQTTVFLKKWLFIFLCVIVWKRIRQHGAKVYSLTPLGCAQIRNWHNVIEPFQYNCIQDRYRLYFTLCPMCGTR